MKKILLFFILSFFSLEAISQSLPANRYHAPYLLDLVDENPSFAYSLRKLSRGYMGAAIQIRRASDNAKANVFFNYRDVVGTDSEVEIVFLGTGIGTIGQRMTYASFAGSSTIYVSIWYDQGNNGYHAVQNNANLQPQLVMNSSGISNNLPSVVYNGDAFAKHLVVNQPIQNLTNQGINGSFMLLAKATSNTNQHSFGMRNSSNWRWAVHINWSNAYCYFDAAEICCATNRRFYNASSINLYRQYSFVRGINYKTMRLNNAATAINNSSAPSFTQTGGAFYLGSWDTSSAKGFYGNVTEVILFPTDLIVSELNSIEKNQMDFWL